MYTGGNELGLKWNVKQVLSHSKLIKEVNQGFFITIFPVSQCLA